MSWKLVAFLAFLSLIAISFVVIIIMDDTSGAISLAENEKKVFGSESGFVDYTKTISGKVMAIELVSKPGGLLSSGKIVRFAHLDSGDIVEVPQIIREGGYYDFYFNLWGELYSIIERK